MERNLIWLAGNVANSGRGSAFLGKNRQRRVDDAAQCGFGHARQVLGEDAAIVEVGGVLDPADANDPITGGL